MDKTTTYNDKLVLGTVQLGLAYGINNQNGKPSHETSLQILRYARSAGISQIDTADAYGDSYDIIGKFHRLEKNKPSFKVFTKFNIPPKDFFKYLKHLTTQLVVPAIECLSFHNIEYFGSLNNDSGLIDAKNAGLIKLIGVSVYTKKELERVVDLPNVDLVQLPLNLLDNLTQYGKAITQLKQRSIKLHVRSCFLQGFLFMEEEKIPSKLAPLLPYRHHFERLAQSVGISLAQMAFLYPLCQKEVDGLVFGVETISQLKENLSFINTTLSDNLIQEINSFRVKEIDLHLLKPYNW